MQGFVNNIERLTEINNYFRRVLYTSPHLQLVVMSLLPGEDIGEEVHRNRDQFFRFESGNGKVWIDGNLYNVKAGDVALIPQGAKHNIYNTGRVPLKFYTIYGPPNHKDKTIHKTKLAARMDKEKFDGKTTERRRGR